MSQQLWKFPGGLRLAGHKAESTMTSIQHAPISKQLILPLHQHIGESAEPIVEIGEKVLKGQMIAKAQGYISVAIHAPTSGVISDISDQPVPHPSGLSAPCITIETDGEDQWIKLQPVTDFSQLTEHTVRQLLRDAGIVGLGGAGFPSFIKLNPGVHHLVETLIINAAECEPYITCDDMLMRERAEGILDGITIIRHALRVKHCIIAIEDNKPDAIASMEYALASRSDLPGTEIRIIPTRYPTGSEKQLIRVVTGKEVPSQCLPLDIGIICHNIGTTYAVGRAIIHGEPLISRIITITGSAVKQPANFETLLGTPINTLLTHCKTHLQADDTLILGGPMMGFKLFNDKLPVTKTTNCLLAGVHDSPAETPALPCIRCGECASVCPVSLLPQQLYWFSRAKDLEKTHDYHLFDCIECGCCSYVCPSKIPLVQYFRYAKTETMTLEQERQKSDIARERHKTRQQRQENEQREKEERHRKRKATLAASQAKKQQASESASLSNQES